jgi:hypothetical protein
LYLLLWFLDLWLCLLFFLFVFVFRLPSALLARLGTLLLFLSRLKRIFFLLFLLVDPSKVLLVVVLVVPVAVRSSARGATF